MSNTQNIYTKLGDEALDAPTLQAFVTCGVPCGVSDEVHTAQ